MSNEGPPRWLIVVRRDQPDLYHNLRESFADVPRVAVILDRREGDRRSETAEGESPGERRGRQRRRPLPAGEQQLWEEAGFRLIHEAGDLAVYESPAEAGRPEPARARQPRRAGRESSAGAGAPASPPDDPVPTS